MGDVMRVTVQMEPIDAEGLIRLVKSDDKGGVVTFQGDVRFRTGEEQTKMLVYEAHETMALAQMTAIAQEAAGRWNANVAVSHRIGLLTPGETAVVCVAACAHRAEAFECCRFLIDRIKEDVPIWKKEFGPNGEEWVGERESR